MFRNDKKKKIIRIVISRIVTSRILMIIKDQRSRVTHVTELRNSDCACSIRSDSLILFYFRARGFFFFYRYHPRETIPKRNDNGLN